MEQIIQDETGFEIAVVGMAGKFPGAKNLDEFWGNLAAGKESIQFFNDEELTACGIDQELLKSPDYVKAKGYLEGTDEFDASFFGYSAQEALKMDPQIRAFHECAWHTLEDAGYYPENYPGPIGLYGGGFSSNYWQQLLRTLLPGGTLDFATDLISSKDLLTTRVSYNLGLTGPSLIVNTQCSTSLVAIHLACSALISGECDMALAGGVTFILPPKTGYEYVDGFMLSPDGHCRPFDAEAGGTTWGDGVGIVALKQLRKAVRDNDQIHAIIKGSAINNDGSSKSSFTSSSIAGQADVIRLAHQFAEVSPETIEYVEAHSMGTSLGDSVEVAALKRSFNTEKRQFCGIGSVKSNIGHLMAAAGIAGFIKTILTLKHKKIPATINFNEANKEIDFANSPFYVNSERQDWHTSQHARRAGVNAFGIGGTNAHIVLEESLLSQEGQAIKQGPNILVISARSAQALQELILSYLALASDSSIDLTRLAYSSQVTRKPFEYRVTIVFNDRDALVEQLKERSRQKEVPRLTTIPQVMFTLSGKLIPNRAVRQLLYQQYSAFKTAFDACAALVRESYNVDLGMLAFGSGTEPGSDSREVIFAIEYSLAKWLMSFNVKPSALLSQGAGEYVAAALSEVLSLQDALHMVMKQKEPGEEAESMVSEVRQMTLSEPKIPYVSRVTGSWITNDEASSPEYYEHPLLSDEALTSNINTLRDKAHSITIEIGIGSRQLEATNSQYGYNSGVVSAFFLLEETNKHEKLLEIIGELWKQGVPIDYTSMYGHELPAKVNLPLYPFQRKRYWPETRAIAPEKDQETEGRTGIPRPTLSVDYQAPQTDEEKELSKMWQEVLGYEKVGVLDNFLELGGDSLQGTSLLGKINRAYGLQLSISIFFRRPTIRGLTAYLSKTHPLLPREAIEKAPEKEYYELSSAQSRIYLLHKMAPSSLAYNMPQLVKLEGELDVARLTDCLQKLVARHEVLRTYFYEIEGRPVCKVSPPVAIELESLSGITKAEEVIKHFVRPFDLSAAPLFRAGLGRISDAEYLLIVDTHHIISDGTSQGILISDFVALYGGACLAESNLQYKDYVFWQQKEEQQERLAVEKSFWLDQFSKGVPVLELPTDFARLTEKNKSGASLSAWLSREETDQLNQLSDSNGATLFTTLLAVFNVLLSKLSGQQEIIVGVPVGGRSHPEVEAMMGMFVNTLALRNVAPGSLSFHAFLQQVKQQVLSCLDHQSYPYEALVSDLQATRARGRNPLFDVMFTFQNFKMEDLVMPGLRVHSVDNVQQDAKFDLSLMAEERQGRLYLEFEYATGLFKDETIGRFMGYLRRIIEEVLRDADQLLSEIDILSEQERYQLLSTFNDTAVAYPQDKTVVDMFKEQVERTPNAMAVQDQREQLSYRALNRRSNQLAHCLLSQGLTPEGAVVVLCDRSVDMLAGILGIFKAGGTYVPVSMHYPLARLKQVLQDTQAQFILTTSASLHSALLTLLADTRPCIRVVCLERVEKAKLNQCTSLALSLIDRSHWQQQASYNPLVSVAPDQLAYVLYTSGSTGRPKGVMIEHRGMLNHLLAKCDTLQLDTDSVIAQNASESFDVSVWQFFSGLLVGGTTIIYTKEQVLEPDRLLHRLKQDQVTILEVVPSYLSVLLTYLEEEGKGLLSRLSYLLVTGETLPKKLVERWLALYSDIPMINAYGPTEASDDITQCVLTDVPQGPHVPVGKVLPNLRIYVVDEHRRLCPPGVKGEIVVAGVGVGRGYLNQPEKTAAVFGEDPFSPVSGQRLYCTGDMGRWLPDGNLEFLGRRDQQVKVKGHRIELGEVEEGLLSKNEIREAVVEARQQADVVYLVGYYVAGPEVSTAELRGYLADVLPEHMLPTHLVRMESLPLTDNGKVDRKALPAPEVSAACDYMAPATQTEEILVDIWSEVLKIDQEVISVWDNFFERGGHSLLATTLVNKISKRFEIEFTLADIFTRQTIKAQAESIALNGWLLTPEVSDEETVGITI